MGVLTMTTTKSRLAAILFSGVAAPALLLGGLALAQETATAAATEETAVDAVGEEELVVTGSRLKAAPLNSTQPVQYVGSQTIALQGVVNIVNLLETLPALQSSLSTAQANAAAPTLDLRGMGEERTLVLVDGRRHVAGIPGSAAVDISSIPSGLIERVEVLTGGASAIYGSDAVTGVVNFVMKKDYEGYEADFQAGISSRGDGAELSTSHVWGENFGEDDRGNVTIAIQASRSDGIEYGDRDFTANNLRANDYANPALRYQAGDPLPPGISPGRAVGRTILLGNGNPRFANTPQSLIDRARNAPARAFIDDPRFSISSTAGIIGLAPAGFGGFAGGDGDFFAFQDTDSNGVDDCSQSFGGRYGPGFSPGCWVIDNTTGAVRPFRDGIQAGSSNQSGGDGAAETFDSQSLTPTNETLAVEIGLRYKFSDVVQPYLSAKSVHNKGSRLNPYNSFDDSIIITLDNPFIPQTIRDLIAAEDAAGNPIENVTIARDNEDIFDPLITDDRKTYRVVAGIEGEFSNNWSYDVSLNYGKTTGEQAASLRLEDRYFAAIDAVIDPATGQAVCRSTLDPTALPIRSFLYDNPFTPVPFTTFSPTSGTCRPLNLFGLGSPSEEAKDFQRYIAIDKYAIDQFVASAVLIGDSEEYFSLPGGPIGFAIGAEYRRETSDFTPDSAREQGLGFQFTTTGAVSGEFDVIEGFAEISLPILSDVPFAETLTVNLAGRISEYSTVGSTETWKVDAVWAPVRDIRFRGGKSVAVRAPNISELFSPLESAVFRPIDPCDANEITSGPNPANRAANCAADGIPPDFVDPLTARFVGQTGGNANLEAETADTFTVGVVLLPSFLPGFSASVDYWDIKIDNAIAFVSAQNIVDACYDGPSLANPFCGLFTRNRTPGSPTFLGFNYLLQTQVNFASQEASGIDFDVDYAFDLADLGLDEDAGSISLSISGTWLEDRQNFEVVTDPDEANPEKGEINYPEWALNTSIQWQIADYTFGFYSTYQDKQALSGVEIENVAGFSPAIAESVWIHNASVRWDYTETLAFTFGAQNLTDEEPYIGAVATPVSGLGRTFFLRASARM
jgi:outer membrane receptor protein involved in Fe transport